MVESVDEAGSSLSQEDKPSSQAEANTSLPTDFKVYKPPNVEIAPTFRELPESYFTPSVADIKAAQDQLSARTRALIDGPFQPRSVREAAAKARQEKYPNTTIRVRFPDRTQLEKVFPSTDKIRSVYAFVRSSLRDDVKPIKFILYVSPPKRDLKVSDPQVRDLNLAQLQLAPSSVLLLLFDDESLNFSDSPAPLLPSILEQAIDLPKPPSFDTPPETAASTPPPTETKQPSASTSKQIPKWLKMGLKK